MMVKSLLILTGHSQGLGNALLDLFLQKQNFEIIGISRTILGLQSPRLKELSLDISDLDLLENQLDSIFPIGKFEEIILINNAGSIGEVKPVGQWNPKQFHALFKLNMLAPAMLTNAFVSRYGKVNSNRIVCNISSGAAHKPLEGWSGYCSSKAGLAMFTGVCQKENTESGIRFYSVAPGIIDTEMQTKIRESAPRYFPAIDRFKSYKSDGLLSSGTEIAQKIDFLLSNPARFEEVVQDVRSFELP
jgi:benzil reductase ((S)-benzoin forming)